MTVSQARLCVTRKFESRVCWGEHSRRESTPTACGSSDKPADHVATDQHGEGGRGGEEAEGEERPRHPSPRPHCLPSDWAGCRQSARLKNVTGTDRRPDHRQLRAEFSH